MSRWAILWKVIELIAAFLQKPTQKPTKITKASVDAQVAHQRELYRRNHPK